jgi:hypothetical protein
MFLEKAKLMSLANIYWTFPQKSPISILYLLYLLFYYYLLSIIYYLLLSIIYYSIDGGEWRTHDALVAVELKQQSPWRE